MNIKQLVKSGKIKVTKHDWKLTSIKKNEMIYSQFLQRFFQKHLFSKIDMFLAGYKFNAKNADAKDPDYEEEEEKDYEEDIAAFKKNAEKKMTSIASQIDKLILTKKFEAGIKSIFADIDVKHDESYKKNFKKKFSLDYDDTFVSIGGRKSDLTTKLKKNFGGRVKGNIGLIKSIPEKYRSGFNDILQKELDKGQANYNLKNKLTTYMKEAMGGTEELGKKTKRRIELIARDQSNKFYGDLTREKSIAIGIEEYKWSTSLDIRVRGNPFNKKRKAKYSHYAREGKTFKWSDPPEDGHPSEPVLCRCTANPELGGYL